MPEFAATFHFVEIEQSDDASRRATARENASRNAVVEYTHQSTGVGQHRIQSPVIFPVIFKTEPHLMTGSAVVNNPNDKIWHDPRGSSGVYLWHRDGRGFFLGASIWVHVAMDRIHPNAGSQLLKNAIDHHKGNTEAIVDHHLTFSATAFKDLPTKGLTARLVPRSTGV